MITIQEGSHHTLETRVLFDDLPALVESNEGNLEAMGGLSHDYLVDHLKINDPIKLGRCATSLEMQIPFAPLTEMGTFVWKNMFLRGFRAARKSREEVEDV